MFVRSRYGLLAAVASVAVLAGCGGAPSDTSPPSSAPTSTEQADRPAELSLAGQQGTQLCQLLTPPQQADLGVESPTPGGPQDTGYPGCIWRTALGTQPSYSVLVAAAPLGLSDFMDRRLSAPYPETKDSYTVAGGFQAEQAQRGAGLEAMGCNVVVDVAEGETLWASASPSVPGDLANKELCAKAKQVAELAVTTLESQA